MFKQENRLKKQKDFDRIYKLGRSAFSVILGVKVVKNEYGHNRYGVVVGNTVSKKAVERNKLKRRIRYFFEQTNLQLEQGLDIVTIARPPAKIAAYEEIKLSLLKNLIKLGVYRSK